MYKKYIILFVALAFANGQTLPLGGSVTNSELELLKDQLTTDAAIAAEEELRTLTPDADIKEIYITTPKVPFSQVDYFGYSYFLRDINFFDNIPTPTDFKLGSGDEIILSLWGERNIQEAFTINKDGLIYYEHIGFINLSNKNLEEAEEILTNTLASTYATLKDKDNPTQLSVSLGKLKSVNVYFTGHVSNPGIHLIHPFSDIFSSIVQAGGMTENGSLRSIELIRKGEVVSKVDFYTFFISGKDSFSNIRLLDGDIIHIPTVLSRSEILGSVYNPAFYELLPNETLADLIRYSGGLTANASSFVRLDLIEPLESRISDDNARSSVRIDVKTASSIKLNNGDTASVKSISDVATNVEVLGRVKSPGFYPSTLTLKEALDIAGGFNDPLYRKSIRTDEILILRKNENQFYGLEFEISYDESDKFELISEDKIFVYEDYRYNNNFTIVVGGEVKKKGSFPFTSKMTVGQAIDLAEGLTPLGDPEAIIVSQDFVQNDNGSIIATSKNVSNVTLDLVLNENASITVLKYKDMVNVTGNVYNPGLIAYKQGTTVKNYIKLAGGYREDSLKNKIYIQSVDGKISKVGRGFFKRLKSGDTIVIPTDLSPPPDFDTAAFTADIVTILTNLATIIFIIDSK